MNTYIIHWDGHFLNGIEDVQMHVFHGKFALQQSHLTFFVDRRSETMPSNVYQFLKACGTRMVYETPETRTTLAKDIWAQLKKTGESIIAGAHDTPKAAKERVTPVLCKYKLVTLSYVIPHFTCIVWRHAMFE